MRLIAGCWAQWRERKAADKSLVVPHCKETFSPPSLQGGRTCELLPPRVGVGGVSSGGHGLGLQPSDAGEQHVLGGGEADGRLLWVAPARALELPRGMDTWRGKVPVRLGIQVKGGNFVLICY